MLDNVKTGWYNSTSLIHETVEAKITAAMPSQRARGAENRTETNRQMDR